VLVAGGVAAWLGPSDFPAPVGRPVIVAFGVALLGVGIVLWRLSETVRLRALAAANAVTAVAALVWCLAASGFSAAGTVLTSTTAAALALLAAAQLRAA
jgi:hypothetical protein